MINTMDMLNVPNQFFHYESKYPFHVEETPKLLSFTFEQPDLRNSNLSNIRQNKVSPFFL